MSTPPDQNERFEPDALSDEALLRQHEQILRAKPDTKGGFSFLPLGLLFFFSGLIFLGGSYLNRFSGGFNAMIYNETLKPSKGAVAAVKLDPAAVGKKLFNSGGACYSCHQPTGQGVPGVYPPLAGSEWAQGSEERIIRIVLFGLQGSVHVRGADYNSGVVMPAFGPTGTYGWSDDKLAAVLTYVRSEWGNKASAVTPEKVTAVRTAEAARTKAWTQDELLKIK